MWVCLCKGVTDRQILSAVDCGAHNSFEVGRACGAGTGCGGCLPEVCRLVRERLSATACFDCPEREAINPHRLEEAAAV